MQGHSNLSNNPSSNSNQSSSKKYTKKGINRPHLKRISKNKAIMRMKGKQTNPVQLSQSRNLSEKDELHSNFYCPFYQGSFKRLIQYKGNGIMSVSHTFVKSYQIHSQKKQYFDVVQQRINGIRMRFDDMINQLQYRNNNRLLMNVPILRYKWLNNILPVTLLKALRENNFSGIHQTLNQKAQLSWQSNQDLQIIDQRDVFDGIPLQKHNIYQAKLRLISYMDQQWINELTEDFDYETRGRYDRFQKIQQFICNMPLGRFYDKANPFPLTVEKIISILSPFKLDKITKIIVNRMILTKIQDIRDSLIRLFSKDANSLIELNRNQNFTQGQIVDSLINCFGQSLWK